MKSDYRYEFISVDKIIYPSHFSRLNFRTHIL
nr:MAG TPA: hypothetical protein [Caudoviricetes sp.]